MKILIIGAGLSGCTLGRLLKDRDHEVTIIEKKPFIGGLCITHVDEFGLKFEPFGAHTFHTKNSRIRDFVLRFDEFNGYTHRKGMILDGVLFPFPMTRKAIERFPEHQQILRELAERPAIIDRTNFETACISIFGLTLYKYFIGNYTRNMWGIDPKELTSEWAPKRLELREDENDELFKGQWQGLPRRGYSVWLERMVQGIPVQTRTTAFQPKEHDVVVSSAPIDQMMGYCFGRLQYRGMKFSYVKDERWEKDSYGTINLPQHPKYLRKCNFNVLHKQSSEHNRIQYHEAVPVTEDRVPMYPINTPENNAVFDKYLNTVCQTKNICPLGRLGLFKYLDMDKAVETAFDMVPVVENYLNMNSVQRYQQIQEIRGRY